MEFEQLCAIASHAERVRGRRLALQRGLTEAVALQQTLMAVADVQTSGSLDLLRKQRQAKQLADATRLAQRRQIKQAERALKLAAKQAPQQAWQAWFDGSARPNPGHCQIAYIIKSPQGKLIRHSQNIGHGDCSHAEYSALIALLERALAELPSPSEAIVMHGDSQVVINDVLRANALTAKNLQTYHQRAQDLIGQFSQLTLRWIPRHRNVEADALTQVQTSL